MYLMLASRLDRRVCTIGAALKVQLMIERSPRMGYASLVQRSHACCFRYQSQVVLKRFYTSVTLPVQHALQAATGHAGCPHDIRWGTAGRSLAQSRALGRDWILLVRQHSKQARQLRKRVEQQQQQSSADALHLQACLHTISNELRTWASVSLDHWGTDQQATNHQEECKISRIRTLATVPVG
jgi:hypothetical protein